MKEKRRGQSTIDSSVSDRSERAELIATMRGAVVLKYTGRLLHFR